MDLAFSCFVWPCEASRKAQTSIASLLEICCFADVMVGVWSIRFGVVVGGMRVEGVVKSVL